MARLVLHTLRLQSLFCFVQKDRRLHLHLLAGQQGVCSRWLKTRRPNHARAPKNVGCIKTGAGHAGVTSACLLISRTTCSRTQLSAQQQRLSSDSVQGDSSSDDALVRAQVILISHLRALAPATAPERLPLATSFVTSQDLGTEINLAYMFHDRFCAQRSKVH